MSRFALAMLAAAACSERGSPPAPAPAADDPAKPPPAAARPAVDAAPAPPPVDPIFAELEQRAASYREPPEARLVPYRDKDRWGYADRSGKVLVEPQFDHAAFFIEGRGVVTSGNRCGLIDAAGHLVAEVKFTGCTDFGDGHAGISLADDRWIVIDRTGKPVTHETYDGIFGYVGSEGLIGVKRGGKIGFLSHAGKLVIPFRFADHNRAGDGRIPVREVDGGPFGVVDTTGKPVIPYEYEDIQTFYRGLALARNNNKWGVIDRDGKVIVPLDYDFIHDNAKADYIVAQKTFSEPPTTILDRTGKVVATVPFDATEGYEDGLIVFEDKNEKSGWIDIHGKVVIPARYDHANSFHDGVAWAANNRRGGFIDKRGKYVVKPRYGASYDYMRMIDGAIDVRDGPGSELRFFIDSKGREYLSPDTRAWFAKQPPEE